MDLYAKTLDDLPKELRERITVVPDAAALSDEAASEFSDLLESACCREVLLNVIAPVGPLDYRRFAAEVRRRHLSCRCLRTINMDEYLDENDRLLPLNHPLSFRRYMDHTFFSLLDEEDRPLPENIVFPDPAHPGRATELIEEIGGVDICWGGLGITGHFAFNDPPSMLGEPDALEDFRRSRTRKITISPMSSAQMAMGGTDGNLDVIPKRAVTLGMYELLMSRKIHMTFMRNWHAGLWRRAFLGPVSQKFPGSLLQEHPNVKITLTELAAAIPGVNTSQATGERGVS